MKNNYSSKQLGFELKKMLDEKHDIDVTKIGMWCDFKLNRDVYSHPDAETTEHLKILSLMRTQNINFTHEDLSTIAQCLIKGLKIDLNNKESFNFIFNS